MSVGGIGFVGPAAHHHDWGYRGRAAACRAPAETDEPEADSGAAAKADPVRLAGQAVHVERTTSLTIVTDDGDRVTLNASQARDFAFVGYRAPGQVAAGAMASASSSFSLQVEGSLDAEELREVGKVLRWLRRAGRDGQIDAREVGHLMKRNDLDSLGSVSGAMTTTRSVVALEATATPVAEAA
jgi:hypothetical protein